MSKLHANGDPDFFAAAEMPPAPCDPNRGSSPALPPIEQEQSIRLPCEFLSKAELTPSPAAPPSEQHLDASVRKESHGSDAVPFDQTVSLARRSVEIVRGVLASNNLYTSLSNCLVTSSLWSGLLFHPLCSFLAIRNEFASQNPSSSATQEDLKGPVGVRQQLVDLWASPGVYRLCLGMVFIFNLIESAAAGQVMYSLAFGTAALGNLGASIGLNEEYYKDLDRRRGVEHSREEKRWVQLVSSPGLNWSACDVMFGYFTLPAFSLVSVAGFSVGIAGAAAAAALASPLWLGARVANSPSPLLLNTVTNLGFGLAQILVGSPVMGMACIGWGISSAILALQRRKGPAAPQEQE